MEREALEALAQPVYQVRLEPQELQEVQERLGQRVQQVLPVFREWMDSTGRVEFLVPQVHKALLAFQVLQVFKGTQELLVRQDSLEAQAELDHKVLMERQE